FLARAGAGSAESRAGLDQEVRGGPEGLAQDRRHLPVKHALPALLVVLVLAAPALQGQTKPAPKPAVPSAGNGTMYIGSYKGVIFVVDEATEKVTKEIPVSVGIPTALTLSDDMSRIYVRDSTYEKIEVFDRVTGS